MAKVEYVDYKDLALKAKDIRSHAETLNKELSTAYQNVIDMHKDWYGVRYNELAKDFNELAPAIDEMLKITVTEIPFALETVSNNFSQADSGINATSAQQTQAVKMANVPTPNDVGMRFLTAEVTAVKDSVKANFKNAVTEMNEIENTYNKISWKSESAEAFRAKFTKLKSQITKEIETINTQFDRLMQQTLEDIQTTENKNTVN